MQIDRLFPQMEAASNPGLWGAWDLGRYLSCWFPGPHTQELSFRAPYKALQMLRFQSPSMGLEQRVAPMGSYLAQVWSPSRPQARGPGQSPAGAESAQGGDMVSASS